MLTCPWEFPAIHSEFKRLAGPLPCAAHAACSTLDPYCLMAPAFINCCSYAFGTSIFITDGSLYGLFLENPFECSIASDTHTSPFGPLGESSPVLTAC